MAERASPFAEPVTGDRAGITLSAPPRGSLWQVACWPDSFAAIEKALATACGCGAPAPGRVAETDDGRLLIRIEPLKWWIIGPDGADCPHCPGPDQGAWLDLSHDQVAVAVEGEDAPELMKRLVSLDLRETAFPDLSFATTQMHHMITRVLRRDRDDGPRYQIMVMRSYADNLREIVQHHLAHFGVTA
jgi:heterotetrameric sarcosine oxidase gamma subunit